MGVQFEKRFKQILSYSYDSNEFSPSYSLAALFDPGQAAYVNHSPYDLKTLLSSCVDIPISDTTQVLKIKISNHIIKVLKETTEVSNANDPDDDERRERMEHLSLLIQSSSSALNTPFSVAEKYLVAIYKKDYGDSLQFWKTIDDDLVILFFL